MPRYLNVRDQVLSLKGKMFITDESDHPVFDAEGEFPLFFPAWRIMREGRQVARIRRVVFAWLQTWEVECDLGTFRFVKEFFSFTEDFEVRGGPFDGACVTGRLLKRDFSITHRGRELASATGALFSMRDRYSVELLDEDKQTELFVAIVMVLHHMASRPGFVIELVSD